MAVREHMLDYVIDLLDDATDFSWASAKASHVVLLCLMEQGEIKSWSETEKIESPQGSCSKTYYCSKYCSKRSR